MSLGSPRLTASARAARAEGGGPQWTIPCVWTCAWHVRTGHRCGRRRLCDLIVAMRTSAPYTQSSRGYAACTISLQCAVAYTAILPYLWCSRCGHARGRPLVRIKKTWARESGGGEIDRSVFCISTMHGGVVASMRLDSEARCRGAASARVRGCDLRCPRSAMCVPGMTHAWDTRCALRTDIFNQPKKKPVHFFFSLSIWRTGPF